MGEREKRSLGVSLYDSILSTTLTGLRTSSPLCGLSTSCTAPELCRNLGVLHAYFAALQAVSPSPPDPNIAVSG